MTDERVALITGGTGGLGSVVATLFAGQGWTVALTDSNEESLAGHTRGLRQGEAPVDLIGQKVDVTDPDQVAPFMDLIKKRHGRLDALINTVGGYTAGDRVGDLPSLDVWARMWQLNVISTVVMCRAAIPLMRAGRWGRIVNVSARAGLHGSAKAAAYSATKAAVINLTESLAAEELSNGITVNAIVPGTIDTPANRQSMPNADFTKWVTPQNLAETMLFLCGESAQSISGAKVEVFGRS